MALLVLGGTGFIGPQVVFAAQRVGLETFTSIAGRSRLCCRPSCRIGDRTGSLDALTSRPWDAVIDTCGYEPEVVSRSARALRPASRHYIFISTMSARGSMPTEGMDERAIGAECLDDDDRATRYGARKSGVRDHRGRPPDVGDHRDGSGASKSDDTGHRVKYLLENDVGRWVEFPLCLPDDGLRADPVRKPGFSADPESALLRMDWSESRGALEPSVAAAPTASAKMRAPSLASDPNARP